MTQTLLPKNYAKRNKTRPISFNIPLSANPTKWSNTFKLPFCGMDASRDMINNLLYETKVTSINKLERTHDTIGEFSNT